MNKASRFVTAALAIGAGAAIVLGPVASQAAPPYTIQHGYGVNGRLNRQQNRINAGIADHQLSPRGQYRLEARDNRIQTQEDIDRANNGGHLTFGERNRLERRLNGSSRAIYRRRHN